MRVNRGIRLTVILLSAGCSGLGFGCDAGRTAETPPASSTSASAQAQAAAAVTEAELDAYVKGIRREIEAVRAAQKRSGEAKTPQERGEASQAAFDINTIPLGAEAAGLNLDRYKDVRETVHELLRTLDFQGKIDGPMSIDLSRASEATKQRLAKDAYADLPEASAVALRNKLGTLVPAWADYITLTAVGG